MDNPIIIIGAGLSGLRAASLLVSKGINCKILEARERIGGRVLSKGVADKPEFGKFDLGPTWFWPQHEPVISNLVQDLGLETFNQHTGGAVLLEQSQNSSVQRRPEGAVQLSTRLGGGIQSLVDAIAETVPSSAVELGTRVTAIHTDNKGEITLGTTLTNGKQKSFNASSVIFALPPRLAAHYISFSPSLPSGFMTEWMNTPTWMAGEAKMVAIYDRPF